jgi:ubiquitin carboxyl-terminal hydrolase 8
MLHQLMYKHKYKVLVLDVRSREEFDRAHIKADAIICIEPSVLLQEQYVNTDMNVGLYAENDHQGNWLNNREISPRFSRP